MSMSRQSTTICATTNTLSARNTPPSRIAICRSFFWFFQVVIRAYPIINIGNIPYWNSISMNTLWDESMLIFAGKYELMRIERS